MSKSAYATRDGELKIERKLENGFLVDPFQVAVCSFWNVEKKRYCLWAKDGWSRELILWAPLDGIEQGQCNLLYCQSQPSVTFYLFLDWSRFHFHNDFVYYWKWIQEVLVSFLPLPLSLPLEWLFQFFYLVGAAQNICSVQVKCLSYLVSFLCPFCFLGGEFLNHNSRGFKGLIKGYTSTLCQNFHNQLKYSYDLASSTQ